MGTTQNRRGWRLKTCPGMRDSEEEPWRKETAGRGWDPYPKAERRGQIEAQIVPSFLIVLACGTATPAPSAVNYAFL